ncbi:hypothetical protein BGW42_002903 [Actinomortierella wolfii]|nr:hypothetical protein BGW42_002903 [Actinomortierella wolfii]
MQNTQARDDHAGTADHSSTAVDIDHLAASVYATPDTGEVPPDDDDTTPEPTTAPVPASTSLPTISNNQQSLPKNANTLPATISSRADVNDALQRRTTRWNRLYLLGVWTIGFVLIALLLTVFVSPLVAQRVLDHAVVLRIQQTDISEIDEEGFTVHIKTSISVDPSRDGVFGLTKWTQHLQPQLTIEPTTLHLFMPNVLFHAIEVGSNPVRQASTRFIVGQKLGEEKRERMGSFHVPQQVIQMSEEATLLEVTTHVNVTNAPVLASFFQAALSTSVLELGVEGKLRTRLGKLWFMNLELVRLVPVEGMKGIQDTTLVSMALPGDDPQGGVTMEGVARLHNPSSSLSISLGKLTFGVYLSSHDLENPITPKPVTPDMVVMAPHQSHQQYKVAELQCSNVELKAHETVDLAVHGRLFHMDDWVPSAATAAWSPIHIASNQNLKSEKELMLSRLLSRYIQGKDSLVTVRALPEPEMAQWLQVVVQSIVLNICFPGSLQEDFIEGIEMRQLSFGFDEENSLDTLAPANSAAISGRLVSRLQLPENITFPITVAELYPEVALFPIDASDRSKDETWAKPVPMARIELPAGSLPAKSKQDGNKLQVDVSFDQGKLVVLPGQEQEFYRFLNESFLQDEITFGVTGSARAYVNTGMGSFELGPIPFTTRTTQKGLGGLVSVPPKLEQIDIVDSTSHSLTIRARLVITNPSSISADLGSLSFFWGYNGFLIGLATVPRAVLQPGENMVETFGMMDPALDCRQRAHDPTCNPDDAVAAARAFLSGYISGDNTTAIDVLGHAESTKLPLLQPVISSLKLRSTLPVMEEDFLLSSTMYLLPASIVLELRNPLDTMIWVLYLNGTAFYKGEPLGHVRVDFEHDITTPKPIEIPANDHRGEPDSGYVKTPRLPVTYELSSVGYEALKRALGGTLEVDVLCHIKARVGNMILWIDYRRESVPTQVRRPLERK